MSSSARPSHGPPPIPPPREEGYTRDGPAPLYWAKYGAVEADRLFVLHGGPGADHRYLLPQMLKLGERHELVFYDQRGGGQSRSDPATPVTWRTHVEDLETVIRELGPGGAGGGGTEGRGGAGGGSPTIVGYSWGGLLALLFAMEAAADRASPSPSTIVLIDPAPVTRQYRAAFEAEFARRQASPEIQAMRARLQASELRTEDPEVYRHRSFELSVAGYFAKPAAARDLTPFRVVARVQQSVWDSLGDYDLLQPGRLDTIHRPTLVIHGREDPIPLSSSRDAARALGAKLVVIEACGHVPYVEKPNELFPVIESFLQGAGA